VIVLDGNFTYPNIVANGGNAEREDGCGAAGTIYYKNQDLLIIDNNEFNTNQKTKIKKAVFSLVVKG